MKELKKSDKEKIRRLHSIYSSEMPVFMKEMINTREMQRLKDIGQNCGRDYISKELNNFDYNYSRLEHSIGVGLIVWNFSQDYKSTIAALLHDISTPTFSHVIDYYNNDAETQTSTELDTEKIIRESSEINNILRKYGIKTEEVIDYSKYSIADNNAPKLSADRLEYNLYMGTARKLITMEEANRIYKDIIIEKNEDGIDEMSFQHIELARKMTRVALNNGEYMSGEVSIVTNELLSMILKEAVMDNILQPQMFKEKTEEDIVNILNNTENKKIKELWNKFKKFDNITVSNEEIKNKYCICASSKKRYINPLIKTEKETYRITDKDLAIKKEILNFLNNDLIYYSI